jgi:hypothetical protein
VDIIPCPYFFSQSGMILAVALQHCATGDSEDTS